MSSIARFLYEQQGNGASKKPLIVGLLNVFMPCGLLQAMQLYALASGSMIRGALSMGVYALGTAPLLFGFGSIISFLSAERVKQALKVSGAAVIILGLLMVNRGLTNSGFGFGTSTSLPQTSRARIKAMRLTRFEKGRACTLGYIDVKQMTGCTEEIIMSEYSIRKPLQYGENIVEFTPNKTGVIRFSCWMRMVWGRFIVT